MFARPKNTDFSGDRSWQECDPWNCWPFFLGHHESGFAQGGCRGSSRVKKSLGSLGAGHQCARPSEYKVETITPPSEYGVRSINCNGLRKNGYLPSELHNLSSRSKVNWVRKRKKRRERTNQVSLPKNKIWSLDRPFLLSVCICCWMHIWVGPVWQTCRNAQYFQCHVNSTTVTIKIHDIRIQNAHPLRSLA